MRLHTLKLAMVAAISLPVVAQAGVTVSGMATHQNYDNVFVDQILPQIGLGYRLDNGLAVEGVFGQVNGVPIVRSRNNRFANRTVVGKRAKSDLNQYRVDAKYYLPFFGTRFEPYVAAGAGQIFVKKAEVGSLEQLNNNKEEAIQFNVGGGLSLGLTDHLKAFADGRYLTYEFEGNGDLNKNLKTEKFKKVEDIQASLGLQYDFSTKAEPMPVVEPIIVPDEKPKPKPKPIVKKDVDSDGDGVIDRLDRCPGTPRSYAVDANGCPREMVKPVSIPLRVLFDTNKAYIKPQYQSEVAKVANFMKRFPNATTVVEGHTDSRGSKKYNQRLSQRRANAVRSALVSRHGIAASRVRAMGYGEAKPIASNKTKAGRAQNRRVVGVVSGKTKQVIKR